MNADDIVEQLLFKQQLFWPQGHSHFQDFFPLRKRIVIASVDCHLLNENFLNTNYPDVLGIYPCVSLKEPGTDVIIYKYFRK
jgi:hypothetical protein